VTESTVSGTSCPPDSVSGADAAVPGDSPELELTVLFLSDMSVRAYPDAGLASRSAGTCRCGRIHARLSPLRRTARPVSLLQPLVIGIRRALRGRSLTPSGSTAMPSRDVRAIAVATRSAARPPERRVHPVGSARGRLRSTLKRSLLLGSSAGFTDSRHRLAEPRVLSGVRGSRRTHLSHAYAVDNQFFVPRRGGRRVRDSLRADLGLTAGRPIILYAAKTSSAASARGPAQGVPESLAQRLC